MTLTNAEMSLHQSRRLPLAVRVDRVMVWVLLVGFIAFMLTGYAMTRGWMDYALASLLHLNVCPLLVGLPFAYHSAYAVHLILRRHRLWNKVGKAATGVYSLVVTVGLLALSQTAAAGASTVHATAKAPTAAPTAQDDVKVRRFTEGQLAKYNGTNGRPAYVAIDGTVYDVTRLYRAGAHFGCMAGRNVSQEFARVHPVRLLARFAQVGTLAGQ